MGDSKALALLLLLAWLPGCAPSSWALLERFRTPGEQLRDFPDVVSEQYDCGQRKLPYFVVEENRLAPLRVRAGGRFYHRIVYALCPSQRTGVVAGPLLTRIRFKGSRIVFESKERYELKPGRWVVDTVVDLPEDAEAGVYAYELVFGSDGVRFDEHLTFVVQDGSLR